MKFTKILALTLALMMLVCAFAACGGTTDDTTAPVVTDAPETDAPETTPTEDTADADCKHTKTRTSHKNLLIMHRMHLFRCREHEFPVSFHCLSHKALYLQQMIMQMEG